MAALEEAEPRDEDRRGESCLSAPQDGRDPEKTDCAAREKQ